ncbi:CDC27 protein, partial [Coemansia sp. RSA 2599]
MSAAASELLSFQVIQGEQVVTYRRLSNELQIHINEAKRLMAAFYDDHKDRCHATFALTGVRKREMCDDLLASELLVALVDESELSVLKSDLENAEYHVYSLEPRAMQDRNALIAANVSCGNMRDAAELGAIRSSVSVLTNAAPTSANAYSREPTKHAAVVKSEAKLKSTPKQDGSEDVAMEEARPVSSKKAALATSEKEGGKGGNANDRATSSVNKTKSAKSFFGRHIPKKPASSTESAAIPDEDRGIVKQEAKQEFNQEAKTEQQPEKRQIDSQEQVPESEDMGMQSAEEAEPP